MLFLTVFFIYNIIWFNIKTIYIKIKYKTKYNIRTLIGLNSKINIIYSIYNRKLDFYIRRIDVLV